MRVLAILSACAVACYGLAGALPGWPALPWAVLGAGGLCGLLLCRDPEEVDRAAVRIRGMTFSVRRPGRHSHALRAADDALGGERGWFAEAEQGFTTTRGRFVGREEAARIAVRSGQIKRLRWAPHLYSEDLW